MAITLFIGGIVVVKISKTDLQLFVGLAMLAASIFI
jgi:hypothetical protein